MSAPVAMQKALASREKKHVMISRGDLKLHCCESTIIRIHNGKSLPGFDEDVMRIASGFAGGVGGWGMVCGAVSGSVMAMGLLHGCEGTETPDVYEEKRMGLRRRAQKLMKDFEDEFGSGNYSDLRGVDRRTDEGKRHLEELRAQGILRCDEYIEYAGNISFWRYAS